MRTTSPPVTAERTTILQIKMHVSLNRQLQERVSLTSPRNSAPPTGAALLCTSLKPERPFALSPRHGAGASVQVCPQSCCRCGRGEPSPSADVGVVRRVRVQMWVVAKSRAGVDAVCVAFTFLSQAKWLRDAELSCDAWPGMKPPHESFSL
jgi:hypothetical protein